MSYAGIEKAEQTILNQMVARLRTALDETEQRARAATPGPWRVANSDGVAASVNGPDWPQDGGYDPSTGQRRTVERPLDVVPPDSEYGPLVALPDAEHIATWSPDTVLRRVAADRQILNHLLSVMAGDYAPWNADIIATLASVYGVTTEPDGAR